MWKSTCRHWVCKNCSIIVPRCNWVSSKKKKTHQKICLIFCNFICETRITTPSRFYPPNACIEKVSSKSVQPFPGKKGTKSHPKPLESRFWAANTISKRFMTVPSTLQLSHTCIEQAFHQNWCTHIPEKSKQNNSSQADFELPPF